jgi:hypothetical protein
MIFRKFTARPAPAVGLNEAAFATIPLRRRLIASWRRDEASGRLKLAWKLIGTQDSGRNV